jgi:putative flavoprotein involved in K+ transport
MIEQHDTVVIGAGQAGLATSYYLTQHGQEHVILERASIGEAWRNGKWDSFTLVTPNWTLRLPGHEYQGDEPDAFLPRARVVEYLESYARRFNPPVQTGVEVSAVRENAEGFALETSRGPLAARNVVVATGAFQAPKIPPFNTQIAPHITQVHSSHYRNPQRLPAGAVLVVGGGQSGCQIADELCQAGRRVHISGGKVGSLPRRYRSHDVFWWAREIGMLDSRATKLPSPAARFVGNPQLTGRDGGRMLDLHHLAAAGVVLLGRTLNARGTVMYFADDLQANLAHADKFAAEFAEALDKYIAENGIDAPLETEPKVRAGYAAPIITELDLDAEGIIVVVWATGYRFDFSWVEFPIFDEFGYPHQQQGVTAIPGLYFVGLPWLHTLKSSLMVGVGEDAAHIVANIVGRVTAMDAPPPRQAEGGDKSSLRVTR